MNDAAEFLRLILRLAALLVVVPATYYFIYWLPFSLIPLGGQRWIASVVSLLCAVGAGWYVWRRLGEAHPGLVTNTVLGAVVVGAIGFCGGFFGPMIFAPEANQGPLLGLFITGPLGFLLGGVGGCLWWLARRRSAGTH